MLSFLLGTYIIGVLACICISLIYRIYLDDAERRGVWFDILFTLTWPVFVILGYFWAEEIDRMLPK